MTSTWVSIGVHVVVYVVDICVFWMYAKTARRLWCRRRTDALVTGRICINLAILLSLIYSMVSEWGTWGKSLGVLELTQISTGILLVIGWRDLMDHWMTSSESIFPLQQEHS